MSVFSFQKNSNLNEYNIKIQHVQEVQKNLEIIFSTLKDAESNQRGFLLTEDSAYLTIFNNSIVLLNDKTLQLNSLVSDNKAQSVRADTLTLLLSQRLAILAEVLEIKRQLDISGQSNQLSRYIIHGKKKMDVIRSLMDKMQNEESDLLQNTLQQKKRLEFVTPLFLLLLIVISIALYLISYYALSVQLKKRNIFEKELAKKIEELNRSNTDLEQFAYVASHDLQEPLRKIRSFGDRLVLKHKENLNDDGKSMITKIQSAAGRMQTLIDDLLSFSRLIKVTGKTENWDMSQLLKEVLTDMDLNIQSKNAKIVAGPLPTLYVVPSMIRQLFQNLISNGIKFSRPDVSPSIFIVSSPVKGKEIPEIENEKMNRNFFKIEFTDNGIGFDEKYLDRIFIIFQRLHGKLEYEGTGIGLAVCKKIMVIHEGYISARSIPGQGSTFVLYFPA